MNPFLHCVESVCVCVWRWGGVRGGWHVWKFMLKYISFLLTIKRSSQKENVKADYYLVCPINIQSNQCSRLIFNMIFRHDLYEKLKRNVGKCFFPIHEVFCISLGLIFLRNAHFTTWKANSLIFSHFYIFTTYLYKHKIFLWSDIPYHPKLI